MLEDLRSVEEPLVLVIDDLHELQSPEALRWLELLIARRPAGLRIVLTSRSEPHLNMHGLRLAGELTEIREADLRFSAQEVAELLQASAIELSDEAVALLHDRTEGWAAGLRLAAISLAGHPDPERFVRDFSGSERSVAGYLMAEVLERQPAEVRELLLRTSILDRVTGRLAEAMTGHSDSERILLGLEEANAFVTSLDADRTWFRYHHLFADFLRLELRRTDPASIDALHGVAARWYEEHGHPAEAVRHAQAASDWTYATRVLADSYISLILDGRLETVGELLATFPAEAAAEDAELAIVLAAARMFAGRPDETEAYIEVAERLADTVPQDRRRRFDLRIASTKLWLARRSVDLASRARGKARGGGGAGGPVGKRHRLRRRPPRRGRLEHRDHRALVAADQRGAPPPRGGSVPGTAGRAPLPGDRAASRISGSPGRTREARSSTGPTTPSRRSRGPKRSGGGRRRSSPRRWRSAGSRSCGWGGSTRPSGVWIVPTVGCGQRRTR